MPAKVPTRLDLGRAQRAAVSRTRARLAGAGIAVRRGLWVILGAVCLGGATGQARAQPGVGDTDRTDGRSIVGSSAPRVGLGDRSATAARGVEGALAAELAALGRCLTMESAVEALGARWEAVLDGAAWDERAPEPRRFASTVTPNLVGAFLRRDAPLSARRQTLELLVQLGDRQAEPLFLRMLAVGHCPADWLGFAAAGLARLDTDAGRLAVAAALARAVGDGTRAPAPVAWDLCTAATRLFRDRTLPSAILDAGPRLLLFAPQVAVQACFTVVERLPDAGPIAMRIARLEDWPTTVVGEDPRDPRMLLAYGRGAAHILLGELAVPGALPILGRALGNPAFDAAPLRDGAVQGLAALGGSEARALLRASLGDPQRVSPRVAHALLRLGDRPSSAALRRVAVDPSALIEMRMSAANAYTLLAPGRPGVAREWLRDLGAVGPIGPPFVALDARLVAFGTRLDLAERCARRLPPATDSPTVPAAWAPYMLCLEGAVDDADGQIAARALWDLTVMSPERLGAGRVEALVARAAAILRDTPPNEQHDRVAGAIAFLTRHRDGDARRYRDVVHRSRVAWEGRTNPMGLPFDIPLALGQLEARLAEEPSASGGETATDPAPATADPGPGSGVPTTRP